MFKLAINHFTRGQCHTCCTRAPHPQSGLSAAPDTQDKVNTVFSSEQQQSAEQPLGHCLCHPHYSTSCLLKKWIQTMTESVSVRNQLRYLSCAQDFFPFFLLKNYFKIEINICFHSACDSLAFCKQQSNSFYRGINLLLKVLCADLVQILCDYGR